MITKEHIDISIKRAIEGQSNLSKSQLEVRGFSTPTMRRLVNQLCNMEGRGTYLEVGLFCGGTFVSSFNPNTVSVGVEDHSQDFSAGFELVKKELKENIDAHAERALEIHTHYEDCFKIDITKLPNNIDILFFDGEHSEESQAKALPYYFDRMADTFLFMVDDWAWQPVFDGTNRGLRELQDKMTVEMHWPLRGYSLNDDPIWHNGVALFLINKKK